MDSTLDNICCQITPSDTPFMNNMEEITYWVHTKRAPCLYTYDKINNKQKEQAHCSKPKSKNNVVTEVPSPRKNNKRKLVLIDDDTDLSAYFLTSDSARQALKKNGNASSIASDVVFNTEKCSPAIKPKRMRLQRNNNTKLGKKSKIATSTPKVTTTLRRSLRKMQNTLNKTHVDSSDNVLNKTIAFDTSQISHIPQKKHTTELLGDDKKMISNIRIEDQNCDELKEKLKPGVPNGQFEDESDVSGFTANYIRSTKIHSTKTPRNIRNKLSRNFIKEPQSLQRENCKTVMCVNKCVNTAPPDPVVLNCSTDSSQNVINLVTSKADEKTRRVNRATSLLRFVDPKQSDSTQSICNNNEELANVNVSLQANGTSRYPKRHRTCVNGTNQNSTNNQSRNSTARKQKNLSDFNNSDRKENSEEEFVSRTRSGRKISLKVREPENSLIILTKSTEQLNLKGAVNVAGLTEKHSIEKSPKKKRQSGKCTKSKKSADGSRQIINRDSLRDKSGFTACFSNSDDDSVEVKQRKFFC